MPLSLPKKSDDRPRRRVAPAKTELREVPSRTYSFDPAAARQAWRQVARTRGANAMRLDGRDPGSRLAPLALGLVAIVAGVLWWTSGDDPAPAASEVATESAAAVVPSGPTEPDAANDDRLAIMGGLGDPAEDPLPPPMPQDDELEALPLDAPTAALAKALPPDTPRENVKVLRKLPQSRQDRSPVGGVGKQGLHIDRITMGTKYSRGTCSGPVGKFSIEDDRRAHVCFRAVHRRVEQRVIVHWERNGKLMRRTFVKIGDHHGYRTRAGLPLRKHYAGQWTVRIESTDGIELARQSFEVGA